MFAKSKQANKKNNFVKKICLLFFSVIILFLIIPKIAAAQENCEALGWKCYNPGIFMDICEQTPGCTKGELLCPEANTICCSVEGFQKCSNPVCEDLGRRCYEVGNSYSQCKKTKECIPGICPGATTICCSEQAYIECTIGAGKTLPNPLGTTDIKELIARIISIVLGLIGAIALALFVYGGLVWMTSGGSPNRIKQGKDILIWAIVGLVVIFTSYIILNFVFQTLEKVTQ